MSLIDTYPAVPAKLAAALVAALAEMPTLEKGGKGNYGHYVKYDDLVEQTRPILHKHGLAITQWPSFDAEGRPTLVTYLVHESGEAMTDTMLLLLGKTDPAGQGSGITYARRYAWQAVCGIAGEAEDLRSYEARSAAVRRARSLPPAYR